MKLFFVIYAAGTVSAVQGPLPETKIECNDRVAFITKHAQANLADIGVEMKCEWHETAPAIEVIEPQQSASPQ